MSDSVTKPNEEEIEEIPREKPRARLGPTEVVVLPNSDSEDEDDEPTVEGEDGVETDSDFLKNHPEDSEVTLQPVAVLMAGSTTVASSTENTSTCSTQFQAIQSSPQKAVFEAKRNIIAHPF